MDCQTGRGPGTRRWCQQALAVRRQFVKHGRHAHKATTLTNWLNMADELDEKMDTIEQFLAPASVDEVGSPFAAKVKADNSFIPYHESDFDRVAARGAADFEPGNTLFFQTENTIWKMAQHYTEPGRTEPPLEPGVLPEGCHMQIPGTTIIEIDDEPGANQHISDAEGFESTYEYDEAWPERMS